MKQYSLNCICSFRFSFSYFHFHNRSILKYPIILPSPTIHCSFTQKKKRDLRIRLHLAKSLLWCLYSHYNYTQHKFIGKQKYCSLSDFIIAVMGSRNRCEIEGVSNLFPTPSLKLGSDWDYRLNPVPHYSYYKNVHSLFSHYNYIKPNRISFVQKKKETFGLNSIQIASLFKCLYSHKNYIQHKSISKEKYCAFRTL